MSFNYRSPCYLYPLTCITGQLPSQFRIQQLFLGAGFSASVARRKTVVQLGSLVGGRGTVNPPQCGPGANPREIVGILHSESPETLLSWLCDGHLSVFRWINFLHCWEFEFGIRNQYTGFKIIDVDTALPVTLIFYSILTPFHNYCGIDARGQSHLAASWLTQSFIFLRLTKWMPETPGKSLL